MSIRGVILDLDGTVYRGREAVPGAAAFVNSLVARGVRILYVTNRANREAAAVREHLLALGLACGPADVLTSAQALVAYLRPGTAYVLGEPPLVRVLEAGGFTLTPERPDYVIASLDRELTYEKLRCAATAIARGARFVATNPDKGLRVEDEIIPGVGATLAALQAVTGVAPQVIGKPEPLIMTMALRQLGLAAAEVISVGDNVETDVPASMAAGIRVALILTGISRAADVAASPVAPTWVVEDFSALQRIVDAEGCG